MITAEQMVQREVLCCMSSLVSTLDHGHALSSGPFNKLCGLADLIEQAHELAGPVLDYEEAAMQAGWKAHPSTGPDNGFIRDFGDESTKEFGSHLAESWEQACALDGLEAYEWEVYEHWAVSQWLADKLVAQGERVDTDFASLNIWARTTTGQAIAMDGCIARIYAEMMAPHTLDSVAPGA